MSTLEFLIALGLSLVLGTSLLGLTVRISGFREVYEALIRREGVLLTVPSLLTRTLCSAGNGVDLSDGLRLGSEVLVRADLDGGEGFPDGSLAQAFESLKFRVEEGRLQWASGRGSYQSLVEGVTQWNVVRPNPQSIRLNVTTVTEVVSGLGHSLSGVESEIGISLWNYRPTLFLGPGGRAGP